MAQAPVLKRSGSDWEVHSAPHLETFTFTTFNEAKGFAHLAATTGWNSAAAEFFGQDEGPTCWVCDGLHGGGFCPLEDRGWNDGPGHAWEM